MAGMHEKPTQAFEGGPGMGRIRGIKVNLWEAFTEEGIIAAARGFFHNWDHHELNAAATVFEMGQKNEKSNAIKKLSRQASSNVVINAFDIVVRSGEELPGKLKHDHGDHVHPKGLTAIKSVVFKASASEAEKIVAKAARRTSR